LETSYRYGYYYNISLSLAVFHHSGCPPKPRFSKFSNLELLYFHGGTTLGRVIKVENVMTNIYSIVFDQLKERENR